MTTNKETKRWLNYLQKLLELFVYEFTVRRSPSLNALRLQRIFDLFNHNGDGFITLEELSQALSRLDLKSTVESYIQPGNAGLNFEDFSSLYKTSDQFQINKRRQFPKRFKILVIRIDSWKEINQEKMWVFELPQSWLWMGKMSSRIQLREGEREIRETVEMEKKRQRKWRLL